MFDTSALLEPGGHESIGEYRFRNGRYEKSEFGPTTGDEVAAQLGKTGAELWEYILKLERFQGTTLKDMIRDRETTASNGS